MIKIDNLTKYYGNNLALDHLSLNIDDGEVFGLIGHNGAGKSTTIKSMVSIINPSSGSIEIDGMDLEKKRNEIKAMIGYVPDTPDLFLNMQVLTFWNFMAEVYGVEKTIYKERLEYLCNIFSMNGRYELTIGELSHGMRQKAILIGALISYPKILILDEPMVGLDPQSAFNLKQFIKEYANQGNTVIFSTHVLEVAEQICSKIGILSKGKLIFSGTIDELKKSNEGKNLEEIYLKICSQDNV